MNRLPTPFIDKWIGPFIGYSWIFVWLIVLLIVDRRALVAISFSWSARFVDCLVLVTIQFCFLFRGGTIQPSGKKSYIPQSWYLHHVFFQDCSSPAWILHFSVAEPPHTPPCNKENRAINICLQPHHLLPFHLPHRTGKRRRNTDLR